MDSDVVRESLDETAVLLILTLKQVMFGFDRLDALGEDADPGSPAMSFYLASIYNYIALLFLLDGAGRTRGGSVYPALEKHGLERLVDPISSVLDEPLGATTFGEVIRVFRNTAIVHSTHSEADLERVYRDVDMPQPENQIRWQDLLYRLREEIATLAVQIALATGRDIEDFGFKRA